MNLDTSSCSKVLELFPFDSIRYRDFEKFEIAIIDKAVVEKPVVIDKNVTIEENESSLSKFHIVHNKTNKIIELAKYDIFLTFFFIFDFLNKITKNFFRFKHFVSVYMSFDFNFP